MTRSVVLIYVYRICCLKLANNKKIVIHSYTYETAITSHFAVSDGRRDICTSVSIRLFCIICLTTRGSCFLQSYDGVRQSLNKRFTYLLIYLLTNITY